MYKVGVLMMGVDDPQQKSPNKVKQVILEVEAKTKISNIFQYLLELNKIKDMNVSVSLEKGGSRINETSTISQVLKYTRPVNGVIKLYCYQNGTDPNATTQKIVLKPSRHEINNPEVQAKKNPLEKKDDKKQKEKETDQAPKSKFCCC